jgi:GalNAc-alpha-(1->4)-GalNAc-alpha-(1->3)-diNAcBac-PP-undecaprenol alpha-1,4-N-acetyl-D-galactosaminyltransferase
MTRRALFVINSLEMGGAQRVAMLILQDWAARGVDATLLVTARAVGSRYFAVPDGVRLVWLADLVPPQGWRGLQQARRLAALRRFVLGLRPDAILSFMTDANIATLLATAGRRQRVVVAERNFPPQDRIPWPFRLLRRLTYRRATAVVMQTRKGRQWLAEKIPAARGQTIPNPVCLPLPFGGVSRDPAVVLPPVRSCMLTVGRLADQKQHALLIDAFARAANRCPDWDLVILGEGPLRAALEAQAQDSGFAHRIHLPGAAGNVADWYACARIFVLTSRYEGFPNSLLEAMAHGCACIALDCDTGPAEMIEHERTGLLLPLTADADRLAEAMLQLAQDRPQRDRLGQDAKLAVLESFAMNKVLAAWRQVVFGVDL